MATARKATTKAKAPAKTTPPAKEKAAEQTHRQRFDQLLNDAVLGVTGQKKL